MNKNIKHNETNNLVNHFERINEITNLQSYLEKVKTKKILESKQFANNNITKISAYSNDLNNICDIDSAYNQINNFDTPKNRMTDIYDPINRTLPEHNKNIINTN